MFHRTLLQNGLQNSLKRYLSQASRGPWRIEDDMSVTHAKLLDTTLKSHFPAHESASNLEIGKPVPQGAHLVYFNHAVPESELHSDGYDNLQAPTPANRSLVRRWRRGSIQFDLDSPLLLGNSAVCEERISDLDSVGPEDSHRRKFNVTIRRDIRNSGSSKSSITELRTLFYFDMSPSLKRKMSALITGEKVVDEQSRDAKPIFSHTTVASKVLIFRYSALSFNAHLIHYDVDYARNVEGMPGPVIQGPLLVTMMLRFISTVQPDRQLQSINYENVGSVIADEELRFWAAPQDNGESVNWTAWITRRSSDTNSWIVFHSDLVFAR